MKEKAKNDLPFGHEMNELVGSNDMLDWQDYEPFMYDGDMYQYYMAVTPDGRKVYHVAKYITWLTEEEFQNIINQ